MIENHKFDGIKIMQLKKFKDSRGFFIERYNKDILSKLGFNVDFVQDNHSSSVPGVIRGLHYQTNPAQGKLVSVIRGKILDIFVDLRANSKTFGEWDSVELSDENDKTVWIPGGFAHGFCVVGNENAEVVYKVDNLFSSSGDGGIFYDDSELKIEWPHENPIVSDKDKKLQSFKDYKLKPLFY